MAVSVKPLPLCVACASALVLLVAAPAARAGQPVHFSVRMPETSYSGSTSDGGTWVADVPSTWNGTLLLYSHGFGPPQAADAPDSTTQQALLNMGYALAGSSEAPATANWWTLGSALSDQFQALAGVRADLPHPPAHVIAFGTSMGGLISALEDERSRGRLDGALTTCGLVEGVIPLQEYQLEGEYAISELLAPGEPVTLANFPADAAGQGPQQGLAAGKQLDAIAHQAQQTPQGRARLALAMAFLNVATWAPGQQMPARHAYAQQEQEQYDTEFTAPPGGLTAMDFVEFARGYVEEASGGNASWTAGVDFAQELSRSPYLGEVNALYRGSGLSLHADLAGLASGADITADPAAIRWQQSTSQPSGRLGVPELDLHTISDQLIPVQAENYYAGTVTPAGELLRQAYVERQGHCNFTSAELAAGVLAIQHRVDTGRWDDVAAPGSLEARATSLGLGAAAFIPYRPAPLTGDTTLPKALSKAPPKPSGQAAPGPGI